MKTVREILKAHYLSGRLERVNDQEDERSVRAGSEMSLGCGLTPGEGVLGRQGFCVRECSTPPGNELAAVVTRSRPAAP